MTTSRKKLKRCTLLEEPKEPIHKAIAEKCSFFWAEEPIDKATPEERIRLALEASRGCSAEIAKIFFDGISEEPEPLIDYENMTREQILEHEERDFAKKTQISQQRLDANIKALIDEEAPLIEKQNRHARTKELIQAREMQTYLKNNPLNMKSLKSDIGRYSSIYVFSFGYAKLESSNYKKFIKSLKDDNSYRVYFGRKKSLSKIVGLVSEAEFNPELKPGDSGYETKELRPGLHEVGSMLHFYDDAAVLLTDKTKDELVFREDEFLALPPRSSAANLCVKLKELGMPVKLSGGHIKLTKVFSVCEDGVRATEDATKILRLLKRKMFKYVLVPLCCWSASTGETECFDLDLPRSE